MVVYDDDVGRAGTALHQRDKAAVELLALLSGAEFAAGIHLAPSRRSCGQCLDLSTVTGLGGLLPIANDLEVGYLFQTRQDRFALGVVDLLTAGVIVAAFHVADVQRPLEVLL